MEGVFLALRVFPLLSRICWDMLSCRYQHWCTGASFLPGQDGFAVLRALLTPQICCYHFSSHLQSMHMHKASGNHPLSTPATRRGPKLEAQQQLLYPISEHLDHSTSWIKPPGHHSHHTFIDLTAACQHCVLTIGNPALLEHLTEALAQLEVSLVLGTLQELFNLVLARSKLLLLLGSLSSLGLLKHQTVL